VYSLLGLFPNNDNLWYYLLLNYGTQKTTVHWKICPNAQATAPSPKELELLTPADGGCSSLTSKEDCLSSKDASVATKKHFKAAARGRGGRDETFDVTVTFS